jgi:hypothetical protein
MVTGRHGKNRRANGPAEPDHDEACGARRRAVELLDEMLAMSPEVDEAVRACAGPPPFGAGLARLVSGYARQIYLARRELSGLPISSDLRDRVEEQLSFRQQMLEQGLLLAFRSHGPRTERIREQLVYGLGPAAAGLGSLVEQAHRELDEPDEGRRGP